MLPLLYPPLASSLRPYNLALALLGEGSLTLWLLAMGVNVERWREQACTEYSEQPASHVADS